MAPKSPLLIGALCALIFIWIHSPRSLQADRLNFRTDQEYLVSDSETKLKTTGESFSSDFTLYRQRYNLTFSKNLYPFLTLAGGSIYEETSTESTSETGVTQTDDSLLQPFVQLNLNNPEYLAGIEYRRTEIVTDSNTAQETEDFRDRVNTLIGWRPEEGPDVIVRYELTHSYNQPETFDIFERDLNLDSRYSPLANLDIRYFYEREETEDRIQDTETLDQTHNGILNYSQFFFDNRLSLISGYRITYNLLEIPATESIASPAGLFALDLTPDEGVLAPTPALIDGDLATSAGINLGSDGNFGELLNIGLDLGLPTEVDQIRVWVITARTLSADVADAFFWNVYISTNGEDWTQVAALPSAPFNNLENRFEISFPPVTTRFIKVVTTPLSPAVPEFVPFADIFVTEIEALITVTGVPTETELTRTNQDFNLNLNSRLSASTSIGYDFFYRDRQQDTLVGSADRSEMSNGLSLSHRFSPIFSTSARLLRTDTDLETNQTAETSYSASLRADYFENFTQSLTFSAILIEDARFGDESTTSLLLRNNAIFYPGWSAFLDTGYSISNFEDQANEDTITVRFGTNVVPNPKLSFNLDYSLRSVSRSGEFANDFFESDISLQAFYVPLPSLSFFARLTFADREDNDTSLQSYSVNWSPFRGGDLQLAFNYNETLRLQEELQSRSWGPTVNWRISRYLSIDFSYNVSNSESATTETTSNTFRTELSLFF